MTSLIKSEQKKERLLIAENLRQFGIEKEDLTDYATFRKLLKAGYRDVCRKYHPDHSKRKSTGSLFKILGKAYRKLDALKTVPMTVDNVNEVLEVTKGYKSLDDIDYWP